MEVTVAEGNPVTDIALFAPAILGDILIFLVSLYFYLATRAEHPHLDPLALRDPADALADGACLPRVENKVSRYLLSASRSSISASAS